jgi:hypothetical protein
VRLQGLVPRKLHDLGMLVNDGLKRINNNMKNQYLRFFLPDYLFLASPLGFVKKLGMTFPVVKI